MVGVYFQFIEIIQDCLIFSINSTKLSQPSRQTWKHVNRALDWKLHLKTLFRQSQGKEKTVWKTGNVLTWQALPSSVLCVPATTLSGKFMTLFLRNSSGASSDATTSVMTTQTQLNYCLVRKSTRNVQFSRENKFVTLSDPENRWHTVLVRKNRELSSNNFLGCIMKYAATV